MNLLFRIPSTHPFRLLAYAAITLASLATTTISRADFPEKPVHVVVPAPAGGVTDIVARLLAKKLSDAFRQPVVVDNRPGGGGNVGVGSVARAAPDGYTLAMSTVGPHGANPALYGTMPFNPVADFAPISLLAAFPNIISVHPAVPVKNLSELLALARKSPGGLSYASSGNGTSGHLGMEMLKSQTGAPLLHIPYKGGAPAIADVMAGHVPVLVDSVVSSLPQLRAGKLRAIAHTGTGSISVAPEIPAVADTLSGFEATSWVGLLAPARTPPEIIRRLNEETVKAVNSDEFRQTLASRGAQALSSTPEQFAAYIRAEIDKWGAVVRAANIRAD